MTMTDTEVLDLNLPMTCAVPRWFPPAPTVNVDRHSGLEVVLDGGRVLRDKFPEEWATKWLRLYAELIGKLRSGEHVSDFYARDFQKIEMHAQVPSSWGNPTERTCPTCSGKGTVPF